MCHVSAPPREISSGCQSHSAFKTTFNYVQRESPCATRWPGVFRTFIVIHIAVAYYSSADWTSFKVNKNVLANCCFQSDGRKCPTRSIRLTLWGRKRKKMLTDASCSLSSLDSSKLFGVRSAAPGTPEPGFPAPPPKSPSLHLDASLLVTMIIISK